MANSQRFRETALVAQSQSYTAGADPAKSLITPFGLYAKGESAKSHISILRGNLATRD
jgi:hypothetical protein